jgi:nifR3 family TIM-barrel protein
MVRFADDERPRSVQLYGVNPVVMGDAVRRVVDLGVDHIDLNFGCPAAKVTRKGGGAALPVHHVLFRSIVQAAVRNAEHVPVTVKLRMGVDDAHITYLDAGRAAEDEGAAAVSLHARTAEQLYSGDAHWRAIAMLKDAVRTIPVLGNGDIWEASDALRMAEATGCDGVVVGRGCLGRPWLFGDLAAAFAGRPVPPAPNLGVVMDTMRLHLRLLAELLGEDGACRDFRKHTSWYVTGFPVGAEKRKALSSISTFADLERLLADLDPSMPFPPEAHRIKRGHTRGPRPVALPPQWLETAEDPTPPAGAELLVSGG